MPPTLEQIRARRDALREAVLNSKPPMYSGPEIPTAFDPNWQSFVNLTPDQIAWFQAQPEWRNFLASAELNPAATVTINTNSLLNAGPISN